MQGSGLFDVVDVRHYDCEIVYDADGYIDLLNTFSGHIVMEPGQRDRLYTEIRRRLGERPDGRLRRHWEPSSTSGAGGTESGRIPWPAFGECVQQLGRHDNKEVVVT